MRGDKIGSIAVYFGASCEADLSYGQLRDALRRSGDGGGWIFDSFNSYSWLYLGSFSVALGAVAVALAFPPLPSRSRDELQPA